MHVLTEIQILAVMFVNDDHDILYPSHGEIHSLHLTILCVFLLWKFLLSLTLLSTQCPSSRILDRMGSDPLQLLQSAAT